MKTIKINDYIAKRNKLINYSSIMDLDSDYDHLDYYRKLASTLDLNAYLPDGDTLLISTIKCNDPEKIKERNGRPIPAGKIKNKIKFLLDNGVDLDKNDNGRYCFPPLSHCIQVKEDYGFDIFKMLIDAGCDFNKASRDERAANYMKVGKLNEGNTPLMIACYHAKRKFAELVKSVGIETADNSIAADANRVYCFNKMCCTAVSSKGKGSGY